MSYLLKNDDITLRISQLGGELTSIFDNHNAKEYLWNADPAFWARHSPILFPFVGSCKNKSYTYQGKTYPMMQHGFARDMQFKLISQTEDEIWLGLNSTKETLNIYPFRFRLELGYRISKRQIHVLWKVINNDSEIMYFSIGAHPGFYCPLDSDKSQSDYYLCFDTEKPISYLLVNSEGLEVKENINSKHILTTDYGTLPIVPNMFDNDALIIEGKQCSKLSLLNPDRSPYLSVSFDAPLFAIWSPAGKNAPFLCIEPWYGRCDSEAFNGTLEDKDYINKLAVGESFESGYTIEIN